MLCGETEVLSLKWVLGKYLLAQNENGPVYHGYIMINEAVQVYVLTSKEFVNSFYPVVHV